MKARELLDYLAREGDCGLIGSFSQAGYDIILRALGLLAAAEEEGTPETDNLLRCHDPDDNCFECLTELTRQLERERNGLAARVAELESLGPIDMSVCGVGRTPRSKP